VKLEKAARYAESRIGVHLWVDYLRMARELGYDLTEATVAMPKDLRERHDAAAELLEIRKDQAAAAAYAKRYKKLCRKYEFALSGLRIVEERQRDRARGQDAAPLCGRLCRAAY